MIIDLQQKEVNVVSGGTWTAAFCAFVCLSAAQLYKMQREGTCSDEKGLWSTTKCYTYGLLSPMAAIGAEVLERGMNFVRDNAPKVIAIGVAAYVRVRNKISFHN